jgi:hypothetical protein
MHREGSKRKRGRGRKVRGTWRAGRAEAGREVSVNAGCTDAVRGGGVGEERGIGTEGGWGRGDGCGLSSKIFSVMGLGRLESHSPNIDFFYFF